MKNENKFWLQAWEVQNIFFNQAETNPYLIAYDSELNLLPDDQVFVPLCGKSIDMLWLAQKYRVLGVELSPLACEAFFEENHLNVRISKIDKFTLYQGERITILSGDFFDLNRALLKNIHAVYDRAALIALPNLVRKRYVQKLREILMPTLNMLLISVSYNQNEMNGPPYSVNEQEVHELFHLNYRIKRLADISERLPERFKVRGLKQINTQVYHLRLDH